MEVLEDRLAARLEAESLVVRLQHRVVAHAVEPEKLAAGRRDLGLGPVQQTLAEPQPRVRPPHPATRRQTRTPAYARRTAIACTYPATGGCSPQKSGSLQRSANVAAGLPP